MCDIPLPSVHKLQKVLGSLCVVGFQMQGQGPSLKAGFMQSDSACLYIPLPAPPPTQAFQKDCKEESE